MGRIFKNIFIFSGFCNRKHFSNMALFTCNGVRSYETALSALNGLQSNAVTLEKAKLVTKTEKLAEMLQCLERVDLKLEDIDKLNIVHVSGTKGKGSTCAFTESILRAHGFKTGFFSSPHIVEVRERIRINGKPIAKDLFAKYFWDCFIPLNNSKEVYKGVMPAYFRFLTIMAFHAFIEEKVDVAIFEVGIGGQYDCTNIIRNPIVCGVSSLGMDHMNILGNTIEEIAWNKAGIFKRGIPAITVPQKEGAMDVLCKRSQEIGAPLYLAKPLDESSLKLGIPGSMQIYNASLATQLSSFWMQNFSKSFKQRLSESSKVLTDEEELPIACENVKWSNEILKGLSHCRWPGRCQKMVHGGITFYLDGAHTEESIDMCVDWFKKECPPQKKNSLKILWFNSTGDRQPEILMKSLKKCNFDVAIFTPNILACDLRDNPDLFKRATSSTSQIEKCRANMDAWVALNKIELQESQKTDESKTTIDKCNHKSLVFNSICDALHWLKEKEEEIHILCTGSLHLIGGILSCTDPNVCNK